MKIQVINKLGHLIPLMDSDKEVKRKLKLDEIYEVDIKVKRNYLFHSKFFALLNVAYSNMPENMENVYKSFEHFRKAITISAGHYEIYYLPDGREIIEAKSISFAKMDEIEFSKLYSDILDVLLKFVLQGVDKSELDHHKILNFI